MTSFSTRAATIVAALAVATGLSGCTGSSGSGGSAATPVQETVPERVRSLVAPDTDTFEVDGGTATLACEGGGPKPVILVSGPDDPVDQWDTVVGDLGQAVLACRFALPAGAGNAPATPVSQADALSEALDASDLPGPYLLVGHSTGALAVRRFGQRHPEQLGAAVFLEPPDPAALASMRAELTATGWDAGATQADAEAPASWPEVPVTVFARNPGGVSSSTGPSGTDGPQAYTTLTSDARLELVEGAGDDIDLGATRRVTNEIIRLVDEGT